MRNVRAACLVLSTFAMFAASSAIAQPPGGVADGKQQGAQIAAVLEITGIFAQYGRQAKAGIEAAMAEAKKSGKSRCRSGITTGVRARRPASI